MWYVPVINYNNIYTYFCQYFFAIVGNVSQLYLSILIISPNVIHTSLKEYNV